MAFPFRFALTILTLWTTLWLGDAEALCGD